MTDVLIPSPSSTITCGLGVLTGQHVVGEAGVADTWADQPLGLYVGVPTLLIDAVFGILVEDDLPLVLLADAPIVNPMLMPEVCDDLDLVALVCDGLDLVALACASTDLEPLDCVEA